jgi:hypothetical protein
MGENEHDSAARLGTSRPATLGQRASRPLKTTTLLAALRTTGLTAPLVVDGAINGELFAGWFRGHVAPTL